MTPRRALPTIALLLVATGCLRPSASFCVVVFDYAGRKLWIGRKK